MTTLDNVACAGIYIYIYSEFYNLPQNNRGHMKTICTNLYNASIISDDQKAKSDLHKKILGDYFAEKLNQGANIANVQPIIDLFEDRLKLSITVSTGNSYTVAVL